MKTSVTEIVSQVLARLDESPAVLDDAMEYGSPDFDLRELVKTLMPQAAERVLLAVNPDQIAESVPLHGEPVRLSAGGQTRTLIPLPEHCLRFLYVRMSDWPEEVWVGMRLDSVSTGLRRLWASRHGSRFGSPAISLTHLEGRQAVEVFGSGDDAMIADGGFLPRPEISGDWLHFPESLAEPLVAELTRAIRDMRS